MKINLLPIPQTSLFPSHQEHPTPPLQPGSSQPAASPVLLFLVYLIFFTKSERFGNWWEVSELGFECLIKEQPAESEKVGESSWEWRWFWPTCASSKISPIGVWSYPFSRSEKSKKFKNLIFFVIRKEICSYTHGERKRKVLKVELLCSGTFKKGILFQLMFWNDISFCNWIKHFMGSKINQGGKEKGLFWEEKKKWKGLYFALIQTIPHLNFWWRIGQWAEKVFICPALIGSPEPARALHLQDAKRGESQWEGFGPAPAFTLLVWLMILGLRCWTWWVGGGEYIKERTLQNLFFLNMVEEKILPSDFLKKIQIFLVITNATLCFT